MSDFPEVGVSTVIENLDKFAKDGETVNAVYEGFNVGADKAGEAALQLGDDLTVLEEEFGDLTGVSQELVDEFLKLDRSIKESEVDELADDWEEWHELLSDTEEELEGVADELDKLSEKAQSAGDGIGSAGDGIDSISQKSESATAGLTKAGGGFDLMSIAATAAATGGILLVVEALISVGTAVFDAGAAVVGFAGDVDEATNRLATQLGITQEAAAGYEDTMKSIFANNFGENMAEVGDAVAQVIQRFGELPEAELQGLTEQAFALRDAFGVELEDSLGAVETLMKNFGLSSQEAMDVVASGFQDGLNASGDYLESLQEYAPQQEQNRAGFEAMYSAMLTGAQNGVLGVDKTLDMLKEMRLRVTEMTPEVREALEGIGIDADDFANRVASGAISTQEAFGIIQDGLSTVADESEQFAAGATILGSPFEDMGTEAALAVDTTVAKLDDLLGAAEGLGTQYDDLGSVFEGLQRQILVAFEPLGDAFLDIFNSADLEGAVSRFGEMIGGLVDVFVSLLDVGGASGGFSGFIDDMNAAMDTVISFTGALSNALGGVTTDDLKEEMLSGVAEIEAGVTEAMEAADAAYEENIASIEGKITNANQTLADNLEEIAANYGAQISEVNSQFSDVQDEINGKIADANSDLTEKLGEIATKASEARTKAEEKYADNVQKINDQIAAKQQKLSDKLGDLADKAADRRTKAEEKYSKSVSKINDKISKAADTLQEKITAAEEKAAEKRLSIASKFEKSKLKIERSLAEKLEAFQDKQGEIEEKFEEKREKATEKSEDKITKLRAKLAEEQNADKRAALEQQILDEQAALDEALAEIDKKEQKELDKLKKKYDKQVAALKQKLADEEAERDAALLKVDADLQKQNDKLNAKYKKDVDALKSKLKEEAQARDAALAQVDANLKKEQDKVRAAQEALKGELETRLAAEAAARDKAMQEIDAKAGTEAQKARDKNTEIVNDLEARLDQERVLRDAAIADLEAQQGIEEQAERDKSAAIIAELENRLTEEANLLAAQKESITANAEEQTATLLAENKKQIDALKEWEDVTAPLVAVRDAFVKLDDFLKNTAIGQVLSDIGWNFARFGPVGGIMKTLADVIFEAWGRITTIFGESEIFASVREAWDTLGQSFEKVKEAFGKVGVAFGEVWASLQPIFGELFGAVGEGMSELGGEAMEMSGLEGGIEGFASFIENMAEGLEGFAELVAGFAEDVAGFAEAITAFWEEHGESILETVDELFGGVSSLMEGDFVGAWEAVEKQIGKIWPPLQKFLLKKLGELKKAIIKWATGQVQDWIDWLTDSKDEILKAVEDIRDSWLDWIQEWADKIEEGIDAIRDKIQEWVERWAAKVEAAIDYVRDQIQAWVERWGAKVEAAINYVRDKIQEWVERWGAKVEAAINYVRDKIQEWVERWGAKVEAGVNYIRDKIQEWVERWGAKVEAGVNYIRDLVQEWVERWGAKVEAGINYVRDKIQEWVERWGAKVEAGVNYVRDLIQEWTERWGAKVEAGINYVRDQIQAWVERWREKVEAAVNSVRDKIQEWVDRWGGEVEASINGIRDSFEDWIGDWKTPVEDAIEGVKTAITKKWGEIKTAIGEIIGLNDEQGIRADIIGGWNSISTRIGEIIGTSANTDGSGGTGVWGKITSGFYNIKNMLTDMWSGEASVTETIEAAWSLMSGNLSTIIGTSSDTEGNGGTGIWGVITGAFYKVKKFMLDTFTGDGGLAGIITGAWKTMAEAVKTALGLVIDAVNIAIRAINRSMDLLPDIIDPGWRLGEIDDSVLDRLDTDIFSTLTATSVTVTDSLSAMSRSASNGMTKVASGMGQSFQVTLGNEFERANQSAETLGSNLSISFANGMMDEYATVVEAARAIASAAVDEMQAELEINSPSKVAWELGGFTTEGFGLGMEDKAADLDQIVGSMLMSVTSPMMGNAVPIVDSVGGSTTHITNVFEIGGNTINSGMDEAVFEARVVDVLRRNM